MINRNELVPIGRINKPHGIKGALSFNITNNFYKKIKIFFFIFDLDCIFVPFKIESCHFISDSIALVKLKNINTRDQAKFLSYKEIFLYKKEIIKNEEKKESWDYFINFDLIDEKIGKIGVITDIDKSTINTLFIINKQGKEVLIPTANQLITFIDDKKKRIFMKLPDGLL